MAAGVQVRDRGWNRIKRDMGELGRSSVKVGIRSGGGGATGGALEKATSKASRPARRGKPARRKVMAQSDVQVVEYAIFNEYGTEHTPARAFFRRTADEHEDRLRQYARGLLPGLLSGARSADAVLDAVGQYYQNRMKQVVRDAGSWAEPNAPATIAMKGSSKPLIDHGVMINSIDYEKVRK